MPKVKLDKVKYNDANGVLSDNPADVQKTDINNDPLKPYLNKLQAIELMEIFQKTNLTITQLNKFITTFNDQGSIDGITDGQAIIWDDTNQEWKAVNYVEHPFDPSNSKVKNSQGSIVDIDAMDGTTDDKTIPTVKMLTDTEMVVTFEDNSTGTFKIKGS